MRAVDAYRHRWSSWPGSRAKSFRACQVLRPRRVARTLAMAHADVLPSATQTASAPGTSFLSRLHGWPARTPADASPTSSRMSAHGLGPMWFAIPSSQGTCTPYSLPVSRRTCVKTHFACTSRKIDLLERAVFNYFQGRKGQTTPQTEIASRFHTASTRSRSRGRREPVIARARDSLQPCPELYFNLPSLAAGAPQAGKVWTFRVHRQLSPDLLRADDIIQ